MQRYGGALLALLEDRGKMLEVRNDFAAFGRTCHFCDLDRSKRQEVVTSNFAHYFNNVFIICASAQACGAELVNSEW